VHISTADFRAASAFVIQKTDSFIDANASRIVSLVDPQKTFGVAVHFAMPILLAHGRRLGGLVDYPSATYANSTDPRASLWPKLPSDGNGRMGPAEAQTLRYPQALSVAPPVLSWSATELSMARRHRRRPGVRHLVDARCLSGSIVNPLPARPHRPSHHAGSVSFHPPPSARYSCTSVARRLLAPLREQDLGGEELLLGLEHVEIARQAGHVALVGDLHALLVGGHLARPLALGLGVLLVGEEAVETSTKALLTLRS